MDEIFEKIDGLGYEVSCFGRVRNIITKKVLKPKKPKTSNGYEAYWQVSMKVNEKRTNKLIHNLMLIAFKKDDRLPILNNITGKNKIGRPSRASMKYREYNVTYPKGGVFIDGDRNNLHIDNLKWADSSAKKHDKYIYNPKYSNVFYTGEHLITLINYNTNSKNKEDNANIIKWLNGDNNAIGSVFAKYNSLYFLTLRRLITKGTNGGKKKKENALTLHDFIIDAQIKMMGKIKKGRFDGVDFKNWSCKVTEKYLVSYFEKEKKKSEWLKDRTESYIS